MGDEKTIEVNGAIKIGEKRIHSFVLKPQSFTSYLASVTDAQSSNIAMQTALFREWTVRHVEARGSDGQAIKYSIADLLMFPAKFARQFSLWQRTDESPEGSIINSGDGTSEPCLFKLGTPLKLRMTDAEGEISELDFYAKTIGDVESVITSNSKFEQTDALIRNCATPMGDNVKIVRLTEDAVSQITLSDGMAIMTKVLPRFLN